jgi:hypothetical protein
MSYTEDFGENMANINKLIKVTKKEIISSRPSLKSVVNSLGYLPNHAIVIGMDGETPVLWNVHSTSAPNIIVWDKLARQSLNILKVIAEYIFAHHARIGFHAEGVEFVVLTFYPEDWGELNRYGMGMMGKTSCIGIIPFFSELADKLMAGLAQWVNERHNASKNPIIILIDGIENVNKMGEEFQNHFRFLLDMGRTKNVYVVGTSSKNNFHQVQDWLDGFQREIYGLDVIDEFEWTEGKTNIIFYTPRTELL